jgi:3-phosphoshikimate 1-carboxyvinyltransferase
LSKKTIQPAKTVAGGVAPPGDKSISHRYAMLAGIAEGATEMTNFALAADCHSTLGCMKALGAEVKVEKDLVRITGRGLHGLKSSWRSLDAGNSGTTIRLLSGILAGQTFTSKIAGDDSLNKRPMKRILTPLREMGAQITARDENFAPLEIRGGKLRGITYQMPMASAQVKSAVLRAGLFAEGDTTVIEPARTRDHTELALEEFGVRLERHGKTIKIHAGGQIKLTGRKIEVPGDLSSAVFFVAAASMFSDSALHIQGVGLNPTRTAILDVFSRMGAAIQMLSLRGAQGEIIGDIAVKGAELKGGVIEGAEIPLVIDELPMLAALGPFTEQGIEIRDAAELRVKESDRIAVLVENLRRMGAQVEERPDGLKVAGRSAGSTKKILRGAEIEPHGDHRIAMAFAVAALGAEGPTTIRDAECAGVSYPTFYDDLARVAQ